MCEQSYSPYSASVSLSLSPGLLSVDGLQMGLGERERKGEMWVVKVGHMLREKENERGGDRKETRERDAQRITVTG